MDKIRKLLRRVAKKDRERLLMTIEYLISGNHINLDIRKIKKSEQYRVRVGNYRIIFSKMNEKVIIDSIKPRNESTYK